MCIHSLFRSRSLPRLLACRTGVNKDIDSIFAQILSHRWDLPRSACDECIFSSRNANRLLPAPSETNGEASAREKSVFGPIRSRICDEFDESLSLSLSLTTTGLPRAVQYSFPDMSATPATCQLSLVYKDEFAMPLNSFMSTHCPHSTYPQIRPHRFVATSYALVQPWWIPFTNPKPSRESQTTAACDWLRRRRSAPVRTRPN